MAVTSITLSDPVTGLLSVITPRAGVAVGSLEVDPAVRAVTEDRAGGHGSTDTTAYWSAAAVTLNLLLYDTAQAAFLDEIGPMLQPAARPVLTVTDDEWAAPRQLTLRLDSMSKARGDPTNWPVQIQWTAPHATWEAAIPVTAFIPPYIPSSTGLIVDSAGLVITSAGLVMPPTSAPSPSQVTSGGATLSEWAAAIYGPCTGPKLANDSAGLTLEFSPDLSLNPGDYIALDSQARTAFLNSDPGASVLSFLNFSTSDWWPVLPGLNILRYYPVSADPGAQAQVTFRPAWPA